MVARAAGRMPPGEGEEDMGSLKPLVSVSAQQVPHPDRLAWASIILENGDNFPTLSRWQDVLEMTIRPQLKASMRQILDLQDSGEDVAALKEWLIRYRSVLEEVFTAVSHNLEHASHHRSNQISDLIDTHCRPLRRFETLQQKAMAVLFYFSGRNGLGVRLMLLPLLHSLSLLLSLIWY